MLLSAGMEFVLEEKHVPLAQQIVVCVLLCIGVEMAPVTMGNPVDPVLEIVEHVRIVEMDPVTTEKPVDPVGRIVGHVVNPIVIQNAPK